MLEIVKSIPTSLIVLLALIVLLIGVIGYGVSRHNDLTTRFEQEEKTFSETETKLETRIKELEDGVAQLEAERTRLADALAAEEEKNSSFENQIDSIAGTVGELTKLSQTDPELLQKYSKVYFLNEHYTPPRLSTIDQDDLYNEERAYQFHADAWPYLRNLLEEAEEDEVDLKIISAYRSFGEQTVLKSGYRVIYGSGANQFSADQGYSEHQLGTTVDFTTPDIGATFTGFEDTPEYGWLTEEAYRYGFVLSYPPNNAYYQFEPWHWRFVGVDLARNLHRQNIYFYDMDQRDIDQYLISVFD